MKAKGIVPFGAGNADWRPTNEHYVSIILNSIAGPDNVYKALTGRDPLDRPSRSSRPSIRSTSWWQEGYFGPELLLADGRAGLRPGRHRHRPGMAPTGTWNFQNVGTYFPANNAEPGFVGFPSGEGRAYPIYALGIGSTFSISATSQNPDGAAAVHRLCVQRPILRRR